MDQRLEELLMQARPGLAVAGGGTGYITKDFDNGRYILSPETIEKFAELLEKDVEAKHFSAGYTSGKSDGIIETAKECMDICEQQRLKILKSSNDPSWTEHLAECKSNIEQRFGVGNG